MAFFLRKMPLFYVVSAKSRIENALTPPASLSQQQLQRLARILQALARLVF